MRKEVLTKQAVKNKVANYEPIVFITVGEEDKFFSEHSFYMVRHNNKIAGTLVRLANETKNERLYLFNLNRGSECFFMHSTTEKTLGIKPLPAELACFRNEENFVKCSEEEYLLYSKQNIDTDIIDHLEKLGVCMEYWQLTDFIRNKANKKNTFTCDPITSISLAEGIYDVKLCGNITIGVVIVMKCQTTVKMKRSGLLRLVRPDDVINELNNLRIGLSDLALRVERQDANSTT